MNAWTMLGFGYVLAALGLAWGMILLVNPRKFAEITRVDWLPDVFDVRRKGVRLELRIIGVLMTALALWFAIMLVLSTHHLLEGGS